jgi:hypothetical protein
MYWVGHWWKCSKGLEACGGGRNATTQKHEEPVIDTIMYAVTSTLQVDMLPYQANVYNTTVANYRAEVDCMPCVTVCSVGCGVRTVSASSVHQWKARKRTLSAGLKRADTQLRVPLLCNVHPSLQSACTGPHSSPPGSACLFVALDPFL